MCGIAGIVDLEGPRDIPRGRLKAMTDAIAHRGPDGEGHWHAPGVALGHRRLAIMDPEGGIQPMLTPDISITFNGMIYNFRELRAELEAQGARFETDCDTEVLLHGWRAWGAELPERLDGFFAAAIWDARDGTLALMRDRWGKKPLYYALSPQGEMLFGSDLAAILAGMDHTPAIREDALSDYLAFGYVPEPKSILEGVEKLPPAHKMILKRGAWQTAKAERYWSIHVHPEDTGQTMEDAVEELVPLLRAAVNKRLIADVPLGAFLSGGVDSGAMVALATQARGPGMDACTMAFEDAAFDESDLAAQVARKYGAKHHVETVREEAMADLNPLGLAFTEPFADASALPTMQLCGLAAKHVKVALSGDGGDELFAGYRRYPYHVSEERVKARIPGAVSRGLFGPLARAYPAMPNAPKVFRAKSTFESLATDAMGGLFRATAIMRESERDALMVRAPQYSSADLLREHALQADTDDPLARAQYVDLMTWLPGRMLVKVDRASMYAGVEVRNPLLDLHMAEWAAKLPTRLKLDGFSGKHVLKTALRGLVPSEILDAKKRGFVAPIGGWMTGRFAAQMEALPSRSHLAESGLIEPKAVTALWDEMRGGKADRSRELWTLMMLDGFLGRLNGANAQRDAA
jgi:asparagine synthase (glutamine-hydrolysing)